MDESTVPRPRALRLDALDLSSTDAFVLARIDGATTLDEVADSTGLSVEVVIAIARRLEEFGAIERPGARARTEAVGRYATAVVSAPSSKRSPLDGERLRQVPRRTAVDVFALKLETGDAFLLSIVDGRCSLEEVADILGEEPGRVLQRAEALVRSGAIELGPTPSHHAAPGAGSEPEPPRPSDVPAKPPPPPPHYARKRWQNDSARSSKPPTTSASAAGLRAIRPSRGPAARPSTGRMQLRPEATSKPAASSRHPSSDRARAAAAPAMTAQRPAPAPEESACDLDAETLAKLDAACSAPEGRTHYAILGVPRNAEAKELRRAYFAIAAALHPDRYFGKRLGVYKKKLEKAFRAASDAYEVLRIPARRAEYDGYLRLTRQSAQEEAALAASPAVAAPLAPPAAAAPPSTPRAHQFEPVAFAATPPLSVPPTPAAPLTAVTSATRAPQAPPERPIDAPSSTKIPLRPPVSEGCAAIAERAGEPTSTSSRAPPSASAKGEGTPRASDGRGLLAASKSASLLDGAQKALAQGDAAAAANLYRLALHYAEDAATRGYAQSGLQEARSTLTDTHLMKARYEEKEARWPEAVALYSKALDGRPDDPAICERLASALRHEGHDLVRAARLAELAVSRAPRRAAYRKTLGLIYGDAGLREKALEELEKAFEIDPTDEQASYALAALRKRRR